MQPTSYIYYPRITIFVIIKTKTFKNVKDKKALIINIPIDGKTAFVL